MKLALAARNRNTDYRIHDSKYRLTPKNLDENPPSFFLTSHDTNNLPNLYEEFKGIQLSTSIIYSTYARRFTLQRRS